MTHRRAAGAYEHTVAGREIGSGPPQAHSFGAPGGRDAPAQGDPAAHRARVPSAGDYSPRFPGVIGGPPGARTGGFGFKFARASRYAKPPIFVH